MSSESRARKERPFAAYVNDLAKSLADNGGHATPVALFAIAYAVLDHADAVRDHTRTTKETAR